MLPPLHVRASRFPVRRRPARAPGLGSRARVAGTMVTVAGLTVLSLPLAAVATETTTHPVAITVNITDGTGAAALAGVEVSVRDPYEGPVLASGVTGAAGTVTLNVEEGATAYVVDAVWPGAPGDLQAPDARTEFVLGSERPVDVNFWGSYGTVSGSVSATADGEPLADLSGATLVVASGGVTVQRVALGADGSFTTGALPTSASADYRVSFVPPAGFELTASQTEPNPSFSLPSGATTPAIVAVERQFALVSSGAPSPVPTDAPEPTPTPEPTDTPEPTPTDTPAPTPTTEPSPEPTAPSSAAPAVAVGSASSLGAALNDSSEAELDALLAATSAAGNVPVLVTNNLGQVLGFALQPTVPEAARALQSVAPVTSPITGLYMNAPNLVGMDLGTALLMVQGQRASALGDQLAAQITDAQARNSRIALLNAALSAVRAHLASPNELTFATASSATIAAGVTHAFLSTSATTGSATATDLVEVLRAGIDSASNSQQIDMLRLQFLSSKRNEAFDLMTNFVKNLQDSRSSIIGNMRSTPVAIGTTQWNRGTTTGSFDLSRVPDGEHHLILNFADLGTTVISSVTVQRGGLAATGGGEVAPVLGLGTGLMAVGIASIVGAPFLRRRGSTVPGVR